jgi:hypothetical protein
VRGRSFQSGIVDTKRVDRESTTKRHGMPLLIRLWLITLDCGHVVERPRTRPLPERVFCSSCSTAAKEGAA